MEEEKKNLKKPTHTRNVKLKERTIILPKKQLYYLPVENPTVLLWCFTDDDTKQICRAAADKIQFPFIILSLKKKIHSNLKLQLDGGRQGGSRGRRGRGLCQSWSSFLAWVVTFGWMRHFPRPQLRPGGMSVSWKYCDLLMNSDKLLKMINGNEYDSVLFMKIHSLLMFLIYCHDLVFVPLSLVHTLWIQQRKAEISLHDKTTLVLKKNKTQENGGKARF